jgi:hypothetical protein
MSRDERSRLIHRTEDLRRLADGIPDRMARVAISAEIAKYQARIHAIDNKAPTELPADRAEEIVAKAPRDIIS